MSGMFTERRKGGPPPTAPTVSVHDVPAMQEDWFVREVQRCREMGMPLGCCDVWPECSHVLAWYEAHVPEGDGAA